MTITIPTDASELEELLADKNKMQNVLKDGQLPAVIKQYASNWANKNVDAEKQIKEQTQQIVAEWLKENGQQLNVKRVNMDPRETQPNTLAHKGGLYNPKAMGASIDKEFDGFADYFKAIWHNRHETPESNAKLARVRNAFSSTVPSEGGFLVPESLRSELLKVSLETSIVRPRARVVPMETARVPFPAIDATSNVSSVYGGIVGYWTEEGAALTASQASFGRIVLDAKKLTAYTEVPNELISDSITSFEMFISQIFPEALGFYEDDAFTSGTGVGEPLGYLNAGSAIEVAKESGQAADTIVWENIVKMFSRMLPSSLNRAVWTASIDTFPELATMALTVGTGGSAVWLNNGVEGPPMTILGRPVIFTEKNPVIGDAGDLNFVDLGYYLIGDRQVMSAKSSEHSKFQEDKTAYRIIERVDGQPWLQSAITPKNNGATLSPFVKIAARA